MKIIKIIVSLSLIFTTLASAQNDLKLNDIGRIVLNAYLPEQIKIPSDAKNLLITKLNQIATNYGMNGSEVNPRFIITAAINIGTKDIIAGPPQMIAQNIEITFFIGDAIENKMYCNESVSLKGVGTNENKAIIDAFKQINPKNKDLSVFIGEAKTKIITYYNTQCNSLLRESTVLRKLSKYDEAIYKLSIVPNVCEECFFRCLDSLRIIYQQKINEDCTIRLQKAKTIWAGSQDKEGAEKVSEILTQIQPGASCQKEVDIFIQSVTSKLEADAKAEWEFKIKEYEDQVAKEKELMRMQDDQAKRNHELAKENQRQQEIQTGRDFELDRIRTKAYNEIAMEYAKNQPKTVYNNINWK